MSTPDGVEAYSRLVDRAAIYQRKMEVYDQPRQRVEVGFTIARINLL